MKMTAMSQSVILFGGGGHAAVVAETAKAAGFIVIGCLDDAELAIGGPEVIGLKRLGTMADLTGLMAAHRHAAYHAAVGDGALREKWLAAVSPRPTPPIISPDAIVSPTASIGDGAFVGPRAVINARAWIGKGVIINSGAIVEHDCSIESFSHVAPGCVLAGAVTVGPHTLVGAGATVIPGIKIGANVTVGAGDVVVSDVPDGVTAIGTPARFS